MIMKRLPLIITNKCNLKCPFCLRAKNNIDLSIEIIEKILDQGYGCNYNTIVLAGGEPYLHSDFDLLSSLIAQKYYFNIITNGYCYEKYFKLLDYEKFTGVVVSLDSHLEQTHDFLRGVGVFKKTIECIKYFKAAGKGVGISFCLNKYNKNDIEGIEDLIATLGINRINFLNTLPTSLNTEFLLSDIEQEECFQQISKLKKCSTCIFWSLNCRTSEFCEGIKGDNIAVNPNGEVIFCCDTIGNGAVVGSLAEHSLSSLLEKSHKMGEYLQQKRKEDVANNNIFPGFNSCVFCNKYLNKEEK